jgi:hypothetical protein
MGEVDNQRQINEKNWYRAEQDLRFAKTIWIFEISKMHCSKTKTEIEIIKILRIELLTNLKQTISKVFVQS